MQSKLFFPIYTQTAMESAPLTYPSFWATHAPFVDFTFQSGLHLALSAVLKGYHTVALF